MKPLCKGVSPLWFLIKKLAFAFNNNVAASICPFEQAIWRGVFPLRSIAFTSILGCLNKSATSSVLLYWEDKWRAVAPWRVFLFGSALIEIKS